MKRLYLKIISLLMAFCMLMGVAPITAFAENEDSKDPCPFVFTLSMGDYSYSAIPVKNDNEYDIFLPVRYVTDVNATLTMAIPERIRNSTITVSYTKYSHDPAITESDGRITEVTVNGESAITLPDYSNEWISTGGVLLYSKKIIVSGEAFEPYTINVKTFCDFRATIKENEGNKNFRPIKQTGDTYYATVVKNSSVNVLIAPPILKGKNLDAGAYNGSTIYLNGVDYTDAGANQAVFDFTGDVLGRHEYEVEIVDNLRGVERRTYKLILDVVEEDYFPVLNNYNSGKVQKISCNQYEDLSLSVEVRNLHGDTNYVWTMGNKATILGYGATCQVDTSNAQKGTLMNAYRCTVTNTVDGIQYSTKTDNIQITINGTTLAPPDIIKQPISAEYQKGDQPVPISVEARGNENYAPVLGYQWYVNTENSNTTGTAIDGATKRGYTPTSTNEGTFYYYCVVTDKLTYTPPEGEPIVVTSTATSECAEIVINPLAIALEGEGTEEMPYLIHNTEELRVIRDIVNSGNPFADMYFAFADDISLPADWVPMGCLKPGADTPEQGINMWPFSGHIDGRNHTLTVAEDGLPLLGYIRNAEVKNLNIYGKKIAGYGLVNNYCVDYGMDGNYGTGVPESISITNCRIKSGTSTLYSGFIGGYASGSNYVYMTNCVVESGVVIGYTKDVHRYIGSLASEVNGYITNCTSAATVYGVNGVGGLVAKKGQSMGPCMIVNSSFTGTIEATGNWVGGILGTSYDNGTAPNSPWSWVQNCYVDATITGKDYVGGICGGEPVVIQCWGNGVGTYSNNVFNGTINATGQNVGAIIGKLKSINKYTTVSNNYFNADCGVAKGIGFIEIIDTSAEHETESTATYVNTSLGAPNIVGFDPHFTDFNRTDDPLGKDAEKLAAPVTAEEMQSQELVDILNNSETSYHNWVQNGRMPVFSADPIAYKLETSGEYKTEFIMGDELDLTGIELTAIWSNGSITNPTLDEVTIEGYDKETRGEQTVKITYGTVSTEIKVNVWKPAGENITVQISVFGDEVHTEDTTDVHTYADGNLTVWISETPCEVDINAKVVDVLNKILADNDMTCSNPSGNYVESITKDGVELGEFTNGQNSGWMYLLNGRYPDLGVDQQYLENGDILVFHYTDDYTREAWMENTDQKAADAITELIEAIGEVSLESEAAIQEAREAYDALTEEQKALVPEETLAKLISAEEKLEELKNQTPEPPAAKDVSDIFKDVRKDTWYHDYVQYVYDHGIMTGMKEDVFAPASILGRAQFATVIWRMEGSPKVSYEKKFKDVRDGEWYTDAVMWASEAGIITGYTAGAKAGCFGPADSATREQMALMMYRYANYKGYDTQKRGSLGSFSDAGRVSSFAKEAMEWAVGYGIISGKDNETRLDPQGKTSRAEAATIITRFTKAFME